MNLQLFDFVDRVKQTSSAVDVAKCFVEFGLQNGACSVNTFFGTEFECQFVSTYPDWWLDHATDVDDFDTVHMIRDVRRGAAPRVESGIDLCPSNPNATAVGLEYVADMFDNFGIRTICTMPMPDRDGVYRGAGMGLGFEDGATQFRMKMDEFGGMLGVAAFTAFTKMSLLRDQPQKQNPLSPRQQQVLLRLSQGKQISGIADDLGITESAVNLYLFNLKQKLKVRTREQALAQAIMNGWIKP